MALSRNMFLVLSAYASGHGETQRDLAQATGLSLGSVNSAIKALVGAGLVDGPAVTPAGYEQLEPYKVDNAVIMAAGLSTRFAPISYEKPKGLLKVKGEVLIERQIRQLKEAGVDDIVVVVGYKREHFFYLESQFGVRIVANEEFAARNNNSTIMRVADLLGNTYICSSDNYFTVNPFDRYVWKAFYSAEYCAGETGEWCLQTGARGRIESVSIGGSDSWYMIGPAYFDREFSKKFIDILRREYDDPRTHDKLWEQIYIEHIKELDMEICKFETGTMFEFDSLDELREFDPLFLENLDSQIFENIVEVLGCTKGEIHDVYPLKQGLTNLSCHFRTDGGEYVYRHPGVGTESMIDRAAEVAAQTVAKEMGLDDTFIYEDPRRGWKISWFIPDCRLLDPHDPAQLRLAMQTAARLHEQDVEVDRVFDYYLEGKRYESLLREIEPIDIAGYAQMAADVDRLEGHVDADGFGTCLTHNDFFSLNLLFDKNDKLYLIDWEYAGMSDYASDYGTFVVTCELTDDEARTALEYYYGRTPTMEEVRHNYAHVALAGWCWYVWSLLKEAQGDYVGNWLYIYYDYARRYLPRALSMYEDGAVLLGEAR